MPNSADVSASTAVTNPTSFRDRDGCIIEQSDRVFRALTKEGAAHWEALARSDAFGRLTDRGLFPRTVVVGKDVAGRLGSWALVLQHERIEVITYPYEWTFGMLKDAALAQLEVLRVLLGDRLILKDGTPFNIQWKGTRPVFIDLGSIVPISMTSLWEGYRQFCRQQLYPLMLQSCLGLDIRSMLRGRIAGPTAVETASMLKWRHFLRRGVSIHVLLQAHFEKRASQVSKAASVPSDLAQAMVERNVEKLARVIDGLEWRVGASSWSGYAARTHYADADLKAKIEFVQAALQTRHWGTVWDLGCNDGLFSRLATRHAKQVVAIEADPLTAEQLYRALKVEGAPNITPLLMDIADASPGQGWRGLECRRLEDRTKPDLVLCLALIHHLVIGANLPMHQVIAWLAQLGSALVIEFVERDDPMVQRLLDTRRDVFSDYNREAFDAAMACSFNVHRSCELPGDTRSLFFATPRFKS